MSTSPHESIAEPTETEELFVAFANTIVHTRGKSTESLTDALTEAYAGRPFVRVLAPGEMVDSKRTRGTNVVELQAIADPHSGTAVVIGAIDNLVKGAAGQAIQNANLVLGLPEDTGLPTLAVYP